MGQPESMTRGASAGSHAFAGLDALFELVAEGVHGAGEADGVVVEADLVDEQHVAAGDGRGHGGAQPVQALQGAAAGVDGLHGRGEVLDRDLLSGQLFKLPHVAKHLCLPQGPGRFRLGLGHLHDVHGRVLGKGLVGLLLAVAGGLADDEVAGLGVGAQAGQLEADEGLDQRAGVARHQRLGLLAARVGPGAQADLHGVHGQGQLLGHEDAEGADDLAPLGLGVLQFLDAQAVHLGQDEIEVLHAFEAALLAHVDVAVELAQHGQEAVMGGQVQIQILPHFAVCFAHRNFLRVKFFILCGKADLEANQDIGFIACRTIRRLDTECRPSSASSDGHPEACLSHGVGGRYGWELPETSRLSRWIRNRLRK
jgi:hypothetical protein